MKNPFVREILFLQKDFLFRGLTRIKGITIIHLTIRLNVK